MVKRISTTSNKSNVGAAGNKSEARTSDLQQLEDELLIDEHALEDCNKAQPELFYRVAKKLALEISRRDAAKTNMKEVEAEVDSLVREEAREAEIKLSEAAIENRKRVHPKVVEATDEYARACYNVDVWAALKEAYTMRSYALKELVSLHLASYYGEVSVQVGNSQLKERAAHSNKQAMNEVRRDVQHKYRRDT